jgi:hypothetical protein
MMQVVLGWRDVWKAARYAVWIEVYDRLKGLKQTQGADVQWDRRILGLIAESAVAIALDIPWDAKIGNFRKEPDVGGYEVRATRRKDGRLIVTPRDSLTRPYLLVIVDDTVPCASIVGWMTGAEARRAGSYETHRENGGCWYVDQKCLHRFSTERHARFA